MGTLYRKVAVNERMPEKDGNYYTEQGFVTFEKGTFWQYEGRAFVKSNSNITNYLEPITDPTAQLKADKAELLEAFMQLCDLKHIKDLDGKTPYYLEQQPLAWTKAKYLIKKHKQ